MSAIELLPDANVRSRTFFVARTIAACQYCREPTRALALAVPPGHETLGDGGEILPDAWQRAGGNAILFFLEHLPRRIQGHLNQLSPFFRLAHSAAAFNSYWANHCEQCGQLLGDHELHCEPDGAFMPASEAAASIVELIEISVPFEASAAGYALEPEFFFCMRKA